MAMVKFSSWASKKLGLLGILKRKMYRKLLSPSCSILLWNSISKFNTWFGTTWLNLGFKYNLEEYKLIGFRMLDACSEDSRTHFFAMILDRRYQLTKEIESGYTTLVKTDTSPC